VEYLKQLMNNASNWQCFLKVAQKQLKILCNFYYLNILITIWQMEIIVI
jgi:hypothetical protein